MATTEKSSPRSADGWASSPAEFANARLHKVTLPSGKAVIRIPGKGELLLAEALPGRLRELARDAALAGVEAAVAARVAEIPDDETKEEQTRELVADLSALHERVALMALVEPQVTAAELAAWPEPDKEMLSELAMRYRNTDAAGAVIGVAPLDWFDTFRDEHACPAGCEPCQKVVNRFSTRDQGEL